MKKIYSPIAKNFTALIIAQVIYKIFAFFTYILVARYLGVKGFGRLSFVLSFVGLFAVCLDFGLSELLIRDVAGRIEELGRKYIGNILSAKLALTAIGYGLVSIVGSIFSQGHRMRILILVLALCLALDSFTIFFRSIFRLFERMEFEALSLISEGILKLGFIFMALRFFTARPLIVAYALLIVSIIIFILTMSFSVSKFVKLRIAFDYSLVKNLLKNTRVIC